MSDSGARAASRGAKRPGVFWIRLIYVLVFAANGTASAYLTLYCRRVGLDNTQIGVLLGVQPVVMLFSGPAWSVLADRLGLRSRLLTVVLALGMLPGLGMMCTSNFAGLLALVIVQALVMGPVTPLLDSIALDSLGNERHRYGTVRAFGSLGYAPIVWATGVFIQTQDIRWIFVLNAVFLTASCIASLRLAQERAKPLPGAIGKGLGTLVRVPGWLMVMSAYFVVMTLQNVTFGFANLYLDQLGASESLMGAAQALSSLGQVLLMAYVLPRALRRWGSAWLLVISLAVYTLRLAIWALCPQATVVALSQLLNAISFGAAAVAAVDFAARHAPAGMEVTSQALATGLVAGSGRAVGSYAGGALYDGIGPRPTFGAFACLGLVAAVGYALLWKGRGPAAQGRTAAVNRPAPQVRDAHVAGQGQAAERAACPESSHDAAAAS